MGNPPKVCVVLGTRPEIIKMSPILRILRERGADHFTLHTRATSLPPKVRACLAT